MNGSGSGLAWSGLFCLHGDNLLVVIRHGLVQSGLVDFPAFWVGGEGGRLVEGRTCGGQINFDNYRDFWERIMDVFVCLKKPNFLLVTRDCLSRKTINSFQHAIAYPQAKRISSSHHLKSQRIKHPGQPPL